MEPLKTEKKKRLGLTAGFHVLGWRKPALANADDVLDLVSAARSCGIGLLEFAWWPNLKIGADVLGGILKDNEMAAAMCCFHPDYDPLDRGIGAEKAGDVLRDAMRFLDGLRKQGADIEGLTGPVAIQLKRQYGPDSIIQRVAEFIITRVVPLADEFDMKVSFEPLRQKEDTAINTTARAISVAQTVKHPLIKIHLDTFHLATNGEDIATALGSAGKWLGYLHASGRLRGPVVEGDGISWGGDVYQGLEANGLENCEFVTGEGFSHEIRALLGDAIIDPDFAPPLQPNLFMSSMVGTLGTAGIL